jgi:hypothetical protein
MAFRACFDPNDESQTDESAPASLTIPEGAPFLGRFSERPEDFLIFDL